jgi:competence protein ComEC
MSWWILKRKIHVSWLIAITCLAIFIGVFWAQYINNFFLPPIIAIVFISLALWRKYIYLIPILIVGGVLLGLWRGSISQDELSIFKPLYGKTSSFMGMVKDDVDIGNSRQLIIRLDDLICADKKLPGVLWITANGGDDIKRGDKIMVSGVLMEGFGNFAGVMYRAKIDKIIHPQPGDVARVVRDWFADAVRLAISDPESSLGIGFLVGQRRSLPDDLSTALQLAGLTHIVVASGYNLTILVRLARRLFVKVSKYLSALSAGVMIFLFIAVTGASPSMSRAGLVAGLSLLAWYYGRKFHPIILLLFAVAVTVLINPSYAWGDLGWQLSFAAFAGVMILAPLLQRFLFGDEKPGTIQQILIETSSAYIMTAPILIAGFGQLSNVAIISNILVLPLVPLAMLLTFVAGCASLIVPTLAVFVGLPATWLLHYMISVAEYLANLPWAVASVEFGWVGTAVCYMMIVGLCIFMWRVTKYNLREVNIVE